MSKKYFFVLISFLILSNFFIIPIRVKADAPPIIEDVKKDAKVTAGTIGYSTSTSGQEALVITRDLVLRVVVGSAATIFFILILLGGYEWMFAGGSEERVTNAKKRIKMAVNGLLIIFTAYIITSFILDTLFAETIITTPPPAG